MADIQKPDMREVWADEGVMVKPTDSKIRGGWAIEIPPRQWENWIQHRQDLALAYLMQKGIPEWDGNQEYRGNKSFVQYGGRLYKARSTNIDRRPDIYPSDWQDIEGKNTEDIAQALNEAKQYANGILSSHAGQSGGTHGLPAGAVFESTTGAQNKANAAEQSAKVYANDRANNARQQSQSYAEGLVQAHEQSNNVHSIDAIPGLRAELDEIRSLTVFQEYLRGIPLPIPGNTVPPRMVQYAGQQLNRDEYPDLWAWAQAHARVLTDAEWGNNNRGCFSTGNGTSTFRVPDLRGEFIRGWDDGRGVDPGRSVGSMQGDQFKSHNHTLSMASGPGSLGKDGSSYQQPGTGPSRVPATSSAGGNETRPRNLAMMYCAFY